MLLVSVLAAGAVGAGAGNAGASTYTYCSSCYMSWQSEIEGGVRHSYTLNYGHNLSGGWIGVRANNVNHAAYGSIIQGWGESTHSYSGANLLFMVVSNVYAGGVGNYSAISANAHGNY